MRQKNLQSAYLMPSLYASLKNALAFVTLSVMLALIYFFVTETWLSSSGDEARCIDLAPCGYDVKSFPRLSRGRVGCCC